MCGIFLSNTLVCLGGVLLQSLALCALCVRVCVRACVCVCGISFSNTFVLGDEVFILHLLNHFLLTPNVKHGQGLIKLIPRHH